MSRDGLSKFTLTNTIWRGILQMSISQPLWDLVDISAPINAARPKHRHLPMLSETNTALNAIAQDEGGILGNCK